MTIDLSGSFSRTLGWITEKEAALLGDKTVAIAGCGGVGGHYAEMLARLGITKFRLADPDHFEAANFNRQNASGVSSIGRMKVTVIKNRILDINPSAEVRVYPECVNASNLDEFLEGVDLYLDGLDVFAIDERIDLFSKLGAKGIPGITVAPLGMGASWMVFRPGSMSFAEYFGLDKAMASSEKCVRFLLGVAPGLLHANYLVDGTKVDFDRRRTPSTPMGCYLCAGVAGTLALKLLLGRGPVHAAPVSYQFDAYRQKVRRSRIPWGYRNPLQRLKYRLFMGMVARKARLPSRQRASEVRDLS